MSGLTLEQLIAVPDDLWIFGYGSLMWDPGFSYLEAHAARLYGYHRAFCVRSRQYRGTEEKPGLVLGLDVGGTCRGRAFRVSKAVRESVLRYLFKREMTYFTYAPKLLPVALDRDQKVCALAFVVNRHAADYTGKLDIAITARIIAQAHGRRGSNRAYLENTVMHLEELGLAESHIHRLLQQVRKIPDEVSD